MNIQLYLRSNVNYTLFKNDYNHKVRFATKSVMLAMKPYSFNTQRNASHSSVGHRILGFSSHLLMDSYSLIRLLGVSLRFKETKLGLRAENSGPVQRTLKDVRSFKTHLRAENSQPAPKNHKKLFKTQLKAENLQPPPK